MDERPIQLDSDTSVSFLKIEGVQHVAISQGSERIVLSDSRLFEIINNFPIERTLTIRETLNTLLSL